MKIEELQKYWMENVTITLKDGAKHSGIFCNFERAEDEPTGRATLSLEPLKGDSFDTFYLDEIESIEFNK